MIWLIVPINNWDSKIPPIVGMLLSVVMILGGFNTLDFDKVVGDIFHNPLQASKPFDDYELAAVSTIEYLKDYLIMPESLEVKRISYTDYPIDDRLLYKVVLSAKNDYGGIIDTACCFDHEKDTWEFSGLYQSMSHGAASVSSADFSKCAGCDRCAEKCPTHGGIDKIILILYNMCELTENRHLLAASWDASHSRRGTRHGSKI